MEVSDVGERTKESRIGDSLVMYERKPGETQVLQHHQLPELQNYSGVNMGGGREGKWSMTLTLTDHCSVTV